MSTTEAAPATGLAVAALSLLARSGRAFETKVAGTSMGSAIPDGFLVRIAPVDLDTIKPGEVIAFSSGERVVAHRLVRRGRRGAARGYVIALGDGNRYPDPPIRLEAILGKVVACSDGTTWRDVSPPAGRSPIDSILSAAVVGAVIMATEIHVPFARWIAGG
jgi:hypothetical protein